MPTYRCLKIVLPNDEKGAQRGPVHGVTVVDQRLFVIRQENKQKLEVYNTSTFKQEPDVLLPGLSEGPYGLKSCSFKCIVYVSDFHQIYTVKLSNNGRSHSVAKWVVSRGNPHRLSLNVFTGNLLVTCRGSPDGAVLEYDTSNSPPTLLREFTLPVNASSPFQAIQLTYGQTVIVYKGWNDSGIVHCLATLDDDGTALYDEVIKGDRTPTDKDELGEITATVDGSFIMADCVNSRVLVMGPSLTRPRQLVLGVEGGVYRPYSVYLDEAYRRLYIGEFTNEGRILVFETSTM